MSVYYNECEPYAAEWLRRLIAAGHLPAGYVDERSIAVVSPDDLAGFVQCHFFAGIGGWALAAQLAAWPTTRELWTGSPPCQPFSLAGKGKAQDDERHLWPEFFRLIRARRPACIMGEQVAAAVGRDWLDGVFTDLEGIGYACGAAVVPACAVNAPHRRERLWFIADGAMDHGQRERLEGHAGHGEDRAGKPESDRPIAATSLCDTLANANGANAASGARWDEFGWVIGHDGKARRVKSGLRLLANGVPRRVGRLRAYGNAIVPRVAAEVMGAYLEARG